MPNYTWNTIKASADVIKKLTNNYKEFTFENLIPQPKTKEECIEKYGVGYVDNGDRCLMHTPEDAWFNWYVWHCDFWGTKWDAFEVDINDECINFTTAWSAPRPIFKKICEMFPNETISFESEYEDNLYIKASNYNGVYIEDAAYKKYYPADIDWDNFDYSQYPWTNMATGEKMYA